MIGLKKKKRVVRIIKIEDWMSKPVITLSESDPVFAAVEMMDKNNIGAVAICEGKKPIGILTERDIIRKVLSKRLDVDKVKIAEVMTKNPVTVENTASLLDVSRLMAENNFRRLLVVKKGELVGIVTGKDVVSLMSA